MPNCIDVGSHKGQLIKAFLANSLWSSLQLRANTAPLSHLAALLKMKFASVKVFDLVGQRERHFLAHPGRNHL
jgi:hypothetical protein